MKLYKEEFTFSKFEESCKKYPDNTAIIYLGEKFTYKKLQSLINRFATGLLNIGVKTKEKVMLFLPNCPQWIIANFAINKIGATVVPVSPIYTSYEIEYIVNDAEVETVICLNTNFGYVNEIIGKTNVKRIIVTTLVDLLPFWKKLIGYMFDKIPKGKVKKGKEIFHFRDLIKVEAVLPNISIAPWNDLAQIM